MLGSCPEVTSRGFEVGRLGVVLVLPLPSCVTLSQLLRTLSEPRFPACESTYMGDTSVRIGCDKSGKAGVGLASYQELSQCWLLSAREVMIFAKKYLSVFFKCL